MHLWTLTLHAISNQPSIPNACYGASKALVNWYSVRINAEDQWLNSFVFDPGLSATDMGYQAVRTFGFPEAMLVDPNKVSDGMVAVLRDASKEKYGGKLVSYTGEIKDW